MGAVDDSYVLDGDVGWVELTLGVALMAGLIALCQWVWGLYWAITFSICVGYACMLSRVLRRVVGVVGRKKEPKE